MYAIIQTGGKQYRVAAGDILSVEHLGKSVGEQIKFNDVLLVGGKADTDALVGTPHVAGASVEAELVQETRGEKILIIKYRRRKGFRKTQGHRQELTRLLITKVTDGKGGTVTLDAAKRNEALMRASVPTSTKKAAAAKAEAPAKKTAKAPAAKKTAKKA